MSMLYSFLYALFFVGLFINGTIIDLLFICLFFFLPMPYNWINNPTPDIASTFTQIILIRYFLDAVYFKSDSKDRNSEITFVAILSALLITLKLSNVVFVLGLAITTFLFYKNSSKSIDKAQIYKVTIFIFTFLSIWIIRGYIQTGYPLFPSSIGKIDFKWTVPGKLTKVHENYVYTCARCCDETADLNYHLLQNYKWLNRWITQHIFNKKAYISDDLFSNISIIITLILFPFTIKNWGIGSLNILIISLLIFFIWLIYSIRHKELLKKNIVLIELYLVETASILFWFFTAPEPRFANGNFIIIFVISLILARTFILKKPVKHWLRLCLCFYPFVMFIWLFIISYSDSEFYINGILPLRKPPMRVFTSNTGLKVLKPVGQPYEILDSELPATPTFYRELSLIGDTLDDGFYMKIDK